MDNKKYNKIEMIAWSVVAIVLTVVLIVFLQKNSFGIDGLFKINSNGKMKSVSEYTIKDTKNLKNISVDMSLGEVELTESKDDNIYVIFKANKDIKAEKYLDVDQKSDALDIKSVNKNKLHFLNNVSMKIELQIPKSYNQNIYVSTDVGDTVFDKELHLRALTVKSDVGDIKLNKAIKCDSYEIKNDTGDIKVYSIDGAGSMESDIGDVKCGIDGIKGDIDIVSNIGSIKLEISKDLAFKFKSDKQPEDIDIDFDKLSKDDDDFYGEYGKNPSYTIDVKSDIGDINLKYK